MWNFICRPCLNPCFNGRWSASIMYYLVTDERSYGVLILVLMEDGLRVITILTGEEDVNLS